MNYNVHNSASELIKPDVCLITEVLASVQFGSSSFQAKKRFIDNMFASLRTYRLLPEQ